MTTETTRLVDAKQRRFQMLAVTVTVVPARIGWRVHEAHEMFGPDSSWHLSRESANRRRDEIIGRLVREGYAIARNDTP